MPYYQYLKNYYVSEEERVRAADGLFRLKDALASQVPKKTISENLLIATWNIREFDSNSYGERSQEAVYYIAEILDHFDLVAIQEVNENLKGLNRVKQILGAHYKVMFSDVTAGSSGNQERLAFLYDSRKLSFTGLAGEIVIPPKPAEGNSTYTPSDQLARTPFIIGLRTSWFKFMIATVHIIYGSSSANDAKRIQEIQYLSDFLAGRVDDPNAHSRNLILLGDFNIFKPNNDTYQIIAENFYLPPEIQNLPSNVKQNRFYDQIAFKGEVPSNEIVGGIFNFYDYVYRLEDELQYADQMSDTYHNKTEAEAKTNYYKTYWRTHQMSDHLVMWTELKIDFSRSYLEAIKANNLPDEDPPEV